jgi:hypothetical protein
MLDLEVLDALLAIFDPKSPADDLFVSEKGALVFLEIFWVFRGEDLRAAPIRSGGYALSWVYLQVLSKSDRAFSEYERPRVPELRESLRFIDKPPTRLVMACECLFKVAVCLLELRVVIVQTSGLITRSCASNSSSVWFDAGIGLDISLLSGLPSLLPILCLLRLQQRQNKVTAAMEKKKTGTVMAAISPLLKLFEVDVPVGLVALIDAVEVDRAVGITEIINVLEEIRLGEDTTFIVNIWESNVLDDLEVASIEIMILDGWVFQGTLPLRFKVWLLNDNHGVNGSTRNETIMSEALERREPMS